MSSELKWVAINEQARVYHYPDGSTFQVRNGRRLCVRETSHRIETEGGAKWIIRGGFIAIQIVADEWTA